MSGGAPKASDVHLALAALSIGDALHVVHSAAIRIAQDTKRLLESTGIKPCAALEAAGWHVNAAMRIAVIALFAKDVSEVHGVLRHEPRQIARDTEQLLESSGIQPCAALESAGRHVNAAMRTAIVTLFAKDVSKAHGVLRHRPRLQLRELNSAALHPHVDRWTGAQGDFQWSVIRNLGEVARQTHEILDAILFWWDGHSHKPAHFGNGSLAVTQQRANTPPTYFSSGGAAPKMTEGISC